MWVLIVISSALGTVDLYPGGSIDECELLAHSIDGGPAQPDLQVACVEEFLVEDWLRENLNDLLHPPP
jgi:hypothetical protein